MHQLVKMKILEILKKTMETVMRLLKIWMKISRMMKRTIDPLRASWRITDKLFKG